MNTSTPQLENARRLLRLGFSVIPLDHPDEPIANEPNQRGKVPAIRWAPFQQARPSDDNLVSWFGNGHKRNTGIPTGSISGIVVVDTDTEAAEDWAKSNLPATAFQVVTAKGRHRYYLHPGQSIPNKARIRDGIDVRGDGGYVVGPGSQHASGHVYRAPEPWPDTLEGVPVFDVSWLGMSSQPQHRWTAPAAVTPPATAAEGRDRLIPRARRYLERTPGAVEGQRGDEHTFQVCCRIVRGFQLDPSNALAVLREWNAKCVPPWSERELEAKIEGAIRYGKEPLGARVLRPFTQAPSPSVDFALSDTGNAEMFATQHGDVVRCDHRRDRFLLWGGHRWIPDADAAVERLAKETIRRRQELAFSESDPDKRKAALVWTLKSESRQRREAMLALARSERPIADAGDAWDRDPWLLGVPNGVIDLQTGTLRDGHPDDRITLAAGVPFEPDATAPLWERTVLEIVDGDADLAAHVQKAFGYSLTGITSEQCAWVCHGSGANGKGTLLNAFRYVVGDYGFQAPFSTVLTRRDTATNDLAALEGRRFVLASEANDGVRLDEARIKSLTGSDPITARFLYSEFFEFVPVAKFWLAVNHRPVVRDDSHAFWRRMRLLPFLRTFDVNPTLADDLKAEAPGILAWAVRGCLLWQAEGLGAPAAVVAATQAYRMDSDLLGDFLAETCTLDPDGSIAAADFYRAYGTWAGQHGLGERERLTPTMFGRKVSERFKKTRGGRGVTYQGVVTRAL